MHKFILSGMLVLTLVSMYLPLFGQSTEESNSSFDTSTIIGGVVGAIVAVIVVVYLQRKGKD